MFSGRASEVQLSFALFKRVARAVLVVRELEEYWCLIRWKAAHAKRDYFPWTLKFQISVNYILDAAFNTNCMAQFQEIRLTCNIVAHSADGVMTASAPN